MAFQGINQTDETKSRREDIEDTRQAIQQKKDHRVQRGLLLVELEELQNRFDDIRSQLGRLSQSLTDLGSSLNEQLFGNRLSLMVQEGGQYAPDFSTLADVPALWDELKRNHARQQEIKQMLNSAK